MANEIKATLNISYINGALKDSTNSGQRSITQTTQQLHSTVVSVGTSEEDMPSGDVATNGRLYLKNLDLVNFVKYGPKTAGVMAEFGRLRPGEEDWLRLATGVTNRWIADTAACKVQMKLYAD